MLHIKKVGLKTFCSLNKTICSIDLVEPARRVIHNAATNHRANIEICRYFFFYGTGFASKPLTPLYICARAMCLLPAALREISLVECPWSYFLKLHT